jgi:hypothetical protein
MPGSLTAHLSAEPPTVQGRFAAAVVREPPVLTGVPVVPGEDQQGLVGGCSPVHPACGRRD